MTVLNGRPRTVTSAVMKTSDCDILIVPGHTNSGEDHWQSRWERQLSTARRVEQDDWHNPQKADWVARIVEAVAQAEKPVVLVGHSLGVIAVAAAAPHLLDDKVRGAFLVGMPDVERPGFEPAIDRDFAPIPRDPLPFPVGPGGQPHGSPLRLRQGRGYFLCVGLGPRRCGRCGTSQHG